MINLVRVEIARMAARRMNRLLVLIVMVLLLVGGIGAFLTSEAEFDRDRALADAQRIRDGFVEECARGFVEGPGGPQPSEEDPAQRRARCEAEIGGAENFIQDKRFKYADIEEGLIGTSFQFILAMVVIGASAMGAEWNNRTMTTTLTWEPNRTRVFAAKVIACAVVTFVVLLALMLWLMAVLLPAGLWRGTMAGVTWAWAENVAAVLLRIGALGSLASILALAIATVGRSTAAALGIVFGYVAIVESLVRGLRPSWQTWLLGNNMGVVVTGEVPDWDPERSVLGALLMVCVYAGLVVGGAWRFFKRADIA